MEIVATVQMVVVVQVAAAVDDVVVLDHHEIVIDPIVIEVIGMIVILRHDLIDQRNDIHHVQDLDHDHEHRHRKRLEIKSSINVLNQPNEFLIVSSMSWNDGDFSHFFVVFLASELQGKTEDEIEMLKTMGFASFDSTKVSP